MNSENYSDPDAGESVSRAKFKRLGVARKKRIMKAWFARNYEDPANRTPWDSGYVYIYGGPYDARSELENEFFGIANDDVITAVADDLESSGISDWTHTDARERDLYPGDYYEIDAALEKFEASLPIATLRKNVLTLRDLLNEKDGMESSLQEFQLIMIFSFCITTLESYLSDTFTRYVFMNAATREAFLTHEPDLKSEKFTMGTLYKVYAGIDTTIKRRIGEISFHNLERVKPLFLNVMGVDMGDISALSRLILKRHNFVHRGGKDPDGETVTTSKQEVLDMISKIESFSDGIETAAQTAKAKSEALPF